MVVILEKNEHNADFHPIVDFIEASPLRRNLKLQDEEGISSLPDMELFENLTLMGYNISPNQKFTFQKDQDRATIAKSSTLPHDTAPRVTSPVAVEGTQEVEINKLKERVQILEDNQGVIGARSADDAPIKWRRIDKEEGITGRVSSDTEEIKMDEGEVAFERTSEDTEEMATVLTSIDAATVLAGGIDVPTGIISFPLLLTFTLAVMLFPLLVRLLALLLLLPLIQEEREKKLWWSLTLQRNRGYKSSLMPKLLENWKSKKKREDKRMTEQIARDAEVARIHAEEELQESTEKTMDQKVEEGLLYNCDQKQLRVEGKRLQSLTAKEERVQSGARKGKEAKDIRRVDYDVDPRVPLILGRTFLRMARALIDVHDEELILRVNDEALTFKTFLRTSDEVSNLDDDYYDTEGDILYLEKFLNEDPSQNLPPMKNKDLKQVDVTMTKPSIEEPPELEVKDLPHNLEYAF
nr:hypothetical protein [Tanacetum cinerariifolium]